MISVICCPLVRIKGDIGAPVIALRSDDLEELTGVRNATGWLSAPAGAPSLRVQL